MRSSSVNLGAELYLLAWFTWVRCTAGISEANQLSLNPMSTVVSGLLGLPRQFDDSPFR